MSSDTFVYWKTKRRPTRKEAQKVIRDFFGPVAKTIRWRQDRFFVTLIGEWSHPLVRVAEGEMREIFKRSKPKDRGWEGRFLEVWLGKDCMDVMTRVQDEFTNVCQRGLAAVFARFWKGKLED